MGNAQKKCQDFNKKTKEELLDMMKTASSERHFQMYEAIRKGATDEEVIAAIYEKAYFETDKGWNSEEEMIADMADFRRSRQAESMKHC